MFMLIAILKYSQVTLLECYKGTVMDLVPGKLYRIYSLKNDLVYGINDDINPVVIELGTVGMFCWNTEPMDMFNGSVLILHRFLVKDQYISIDLNHHYCKQALS
jgi:hypothetical protein